MPGGAAVPIRKRPGQLRTRVELQEGVTITDETGGGSETWPAFGNDWVAIDSFILGSTETEAVVQYIVSMRYRSDLVTKFFNGTQIRLATGDKTLKVLAMMNPEERNRDLQLTCGRLI